jgi:hypothetical protein
VTRLRALATDPRAAYAAAFLVYVGLRIVAYEQLEYAYYPDTREYLVVAREPITSLDFWAGERAVIVPLVYKVLPDSTGWRTGVQLAVSIACWTALASATAAVLRHRWVRLGGFVAVLAFSAVPAVVQWDALVLSESLSISLGALWVATWLVLFRRPGPATVVAVIGASLLWALTRDSNGVVIACSLVAAAASILLPGRRRVGLALLGGLAATLLIASATTSGPTPRWERPLFQVIERRMLPNAEAREHFADRGMPLTPGVRALQGIPLSRRAREAKRKPRPPRPPEYRRWVRRHGRSTYASYLASHPYVTAKLAWFGRERLLDSRRLRPYRARDAQAVLPGPLASVLYPPGVGALFVALGVVGLLAAFAAWRAGPRPVWLVPLVLLGAQVPHALLVWHGDVADIPRHAVLVGLLSRLAPLLLALLALDALLAGRRPQAGTNRA